MGCDFRRLVRRLTIRKISIHASRMGCDDITATLFGVSGKFQSTHPVWDATARHMPTFARPDISIHASRMGCDRRRRGNGVRQEDFNPRIPYGMRPMPHHPLRRNRTFQSTHPVWDATRIQASLYGIGLISIHASRMGCDSPRVSP